MSSFNVTGNAFLRNLYSSNRNLVSAGERAKVSTKELGQADTKALSKGIASLSAYDYDGKSDDESKFYKTIKAFADSYNNTVETGKSLSEQDPRTKKIINDMKKLQSKYGDELERYGITFNNKGYMEIGSTAMDHIKPSSYRDVVGENSEFMKELKDISKKLTRRINYLV